MLKELFNKKNSLILVAIVLLVVLAISGVLYGRFIQKNNATTFDKSGYVVNVNPQAESAKYSFSSGQEYKKSFDHEYEFLNTDGEKVILENDSFLFYDDGSYTSMSKGVLLDIPEIASGNYINHYSIEPFMEVAEGNDYEIENGDNPISLREVLWKTSENKFLVLSHSLKVYFSEEDIRDVEDYVEINYIDAGVIQLVTKDNVWQTVSEDAKIITEDGAIIYLVKGIVEFNEKQMLLSKLVLDSSENIELSPLEQKTQFVPEFDITGTDGEDGESGTSGSNGENGIKAENGLNGNIGGNGSDGESGIDGEDGVDATIDSTFNTAIPQIVLESWEVDAIGFVGKYRVEDPNNLLKVGSKLTIEVVESVTNQKIKVIDANGSEDFGINHQSEYSFLSDEALKPDTEYKLVIKGSYMIDGSEHNRDFLTKVFYTDSLGILIEKNPSKTDRVSFQITKKDYAVGTKAVLYLLTEEQNLEGFDPVNNNYKSQEIDLNAETSVVEFLGDLKSNTKYYARLTVEVEESGTKKTYMSQQIVPTKTLKETPVFAFSPVAISNRSDWLFELYGGNVSDPDKAVVNYIYEVYGIVDGKSELVKSIDVLPGNLNHASYLYIDDISIHPGVKYNFLVRAIYNDNEKNVEVVSKSSSDFTMEGAQLPAVRFIRSSVTAESIEGQIVIDLNKSKINLDNLILHPITVTMTCEGVYSKSISFNSRDEIIVNGDENQLILNIKESGLNQNRIYRFDVEAYVDYIGDGKEYHKTNLGHVVEATPHLTEITAVWEGAENENHSFAVNLKLDDKNNNFVNHYDSSILGLIQIGLYDVDNKLVGNTAIFENTKEINDQLFDSKLKEMFVEGDGELITEETFGLSAENLEQDIYYIKINHIYDYTMNVDLTIENNATAKLTDYVNDYEVVNASFRVEKSSTVPKLPADTYDQITVNPIVNASAGSYGQIVNNDMPDGAIIGYEITPKYNNSASLARKLHLYGFENEEFNRKTSQIYNGTSLLETGEFLEHKVINIDKSEVTIPTIVLLFGDGQDGTIYNNKVLYYTQKMARGEIYEFAYAIEYADDKDSVDAAKIYPYQTDEFSKDESLDKENYVLHSQEIITPKANPVFYMYTNKKTSDKAIVKYMYRDFDHTLKKKNENVYQTTFKVNGVDKGEITLVSPFPDNKDVYWGEITVDENVNALDFEFAWKAFEDEEDNEDQNYNTKIKPVKVSVPVLNTSTEQEFAGVKFSLDVANANKNFLNVKIEASDYRILDNVVGISLKFESGGNTVIYDLPYYHEVYEYSISLSRIAQVIGKGSKITATPILHYDTGNEGWEYVNSGNFALQSLDGSGQYLTYNSSSETNVLSSHAAGSLYELGAMSGLDTIVDTRFGGKFTIDPINGPTDKALSFGMKAESGSLLLHENSNSIADMVLAPKEVNTKTLAKTNSVTIDSIIPSVQSNTYEKAMNYVVLDELKIYGYSSIKDPVVDLVLCKDNKCEQEIRRYPQTLGANCDKSEDVCTLTDVMINELESNSSYVLKMKGTINSGSIFFINARGTDGNEWAFEITTSDQAELSEKIDMKFVYESYNNKYIELGYGISQIKDLKVVYNIVDSTGNILLSSYDQSIQTELTPLFYQPEYNADKLYINKEWFVEKEGTGSVLKYDQPYGLQFRLVRIDENGNYVLDDSNHPQMMGESRTINITFASNEEPLVFEEMWVTTEKDLVGKEKMILNIDLSAINDPNKIIMTEPDSNDVTNEKSKRYYYAYLYKKTGDEEEILVDKFKDEELFEETGKFILDADKSYKFAMEVDRSSTYLLRLYTALDLNYDGHEDDYYDLVNHSIASMDDQLLEENLSKFILYEREPYYTPDDNGISMGNQSLGASTSATNRIAVTYKDAVNINDIDKVIYNVIQEGTGVEMSGELFNEDADHPIFVPRAGGYYTLELPCELKEQGKYHITIEYRYKNDSGSYVVQSRFSDVYVY